MTTDDRKEGGNPEDRRDSADALRKGRGYQSTSLVVLVSLLIIVTVLFVTRRDATEERKATVTARELATSAIDYCKTLVKNGEIYGARSCEDSACTALISPARAGTAAWQHLAGLALYNLGQRDLGLAHAGEYLEKWSRIADGYREAHSTHQLFEAYKVTKEDKFLGWAWGRNELVHQLVTTVYIPGRATQNAMLHLTMAKELAQYAAALSDEKAVQLLKKLDQFPGGDTQISEKRAALLDASTKLMEVAKAGALSEDPGIAHTVGDLTIEQYACWFPWFWAGMYDATRDRKYLDEIVGFFETAAFHSRDPGLTASSLQLILPCLDVLTFIREHTSAFEPDFRYIVEHDVLPRWDSEMNPICEGSGAFLATANEQNIKCGGNVLSISDNAWVAYVLSKRPEDVFELP